MVKNKIIFILMLAFVLMLALNLVSGIWIFVSKIGFSFDEVKSYYIGRDIPKSMYDMFEIIGPHLFSQAMIVFLVAHFYQIFYKSIWIVVFTFFSMFVSNFSPLFIAYSDAFVYLKILGLICFEVLLIWMLYFSMRGFLKEIS